MSNLVGSGSATNQPRLGELSSTRAAFHAARLVLVAVFFVTFLSSRHEAGWAALVAAAVAIFGLLMSLHHFATRGRALKGTSSQRLPAWVPIIVDAIIALGIILVAEAAEAPLAWVALLVPVCEAALAYSMVPAAMVWMTLSLVHMSYVVLTTEGSTPWQLALQQLLAVLLVAVPAAMLSSSMREQISALTGERERARSQTDQLEAVAVGAERMSSLTSRDDVLRSAAVAMTEIGFDQADIVADSGEGWHVVVRNHQLRSTAVPEEVLAERARASKGNVIVIRPDSDESRQILHSADMQWGCAVELDTIGFQDAPVLRAWSHFAVTDEEQTLRAFSLLAQQISNIHSNSVSSEWAAIESSRLAYEAAHDPLTGVANHSNIMATLAELNEAHVEASAFFVDLDRFKPINDTLGHEAGNQALIIISRRLEELIGSFGVVGRMGGDEFIVVGHRDALSIDGDVFGLTSLIYNAICAPMTIDGTTVSVGASVGAASEASDVSPDELVRRADVAMYAAKRSGGGGLVWDASLEAQNPMTAAKLANAAVEQPAVDHSPVERSPLESGDAAPDNAEFAASAETEVAPIVDQTPLPDTARSTS